jgi:hypothetical protein
MTDDARRRTRRAAAWWAFAALLAVGCLAYFLWLRVEAAKREATREQFAAENEALSKRCTAKMAARDAAADARRAVSVGDFLPLTFSYGDYEQHDITPGLLRCRAPAHSGPQARCEPGGLPRRGPHHAIAEYAERYNVALLEIAPEQVARKCNASAVLLRKEVAELPQEIGVAQRSSSVAPVPRTGSRAR